MTPARISPVHFILLPHFICVSRLLLIRAIIKRWTQDICVCVEACEWVICTQVCSVCVCVCTCFPGRKHLLLGVRGPPVRLCPAAADRPAYWTDPLCARAKAAARRSARSSCLIRPSHGPPSDVARGHPVWPNESLVCWMCEPQEIFIACWIEQIGRVFMHGGRLWRRCQQYPKKLQLSWKRLLLYNYAKQVRLKEMY